MVGEPGRTPRLICASFGDGDAEQARRSHFSAVERLSDMSNRASDMKPFVTADDGAGAAQVRMDQDDDEFAGVVSQLKEHILAGDVYQIVPSRTFSAPCADAFSAFALRRAASVAAWFRCGAITMTMFRPSCFGLDSTTPSSATSAASRCSRR